MLQKLSNPLSNGHKKRTGGRSGLLLGVDAHAALSRCVFRIHVAANTNDGSVSAQPIRSLSGRNVYVEKTAWVSERDVKSFHLYRAADGSYGAPPQLDDHGQTVLETLSIERRGSYLFVFINDRPLTELQVDRRVSDWKIYLASGLSEADIKLMAKRLETDRCSEEALIR
jgi:hypothetical protein